MSLRKPYVLPPARLAANRRKARQSTGPRSARGKAQSRLNRLRDGSRSRLYQDLLWEFMDAPPAAVARTARRTMTPELAGHPLFAELGRVFCQAEVEVALTRRALREKPNPQKDCFYANEATKSMKTRRRQAKRSQKRTPNEPFFRVDEPKKRPDGAKKGANEANLWA